VQSYSQEFKEQIVKEVTEVGNISLVCKKHDLKTSTVHGWLYKVKNRDKIVEVKITRELQKKIREQDEEIIVLRALLKKTFPLWDNEKKLS
jgi:transposase-like protein